MLAFARQFEEEEEEEQGRGKASVVQVQLLHGRLAFDLCDLSFCLPSSSPRVGQDLDMQQLLADISVATARCHPRLPDRLPRIWIWMQLIVRILGMSHHFIISRPELF